MNNELRFGVVLLPNVPWDELLKRYLYFEELGFEIAGTGDHFVDGTNPRGPVFELWTLTSAWSAKTTNIRIGTWVTQIPFRNPALLARQALTVDHISNGRLELGLGTGYPFDPSCEMMGIPNWSPRERVARFREYVEIMDRLLTNEVTTYEGQYYKIKEAVMNPRPVQKPRPPILIAALGPAMTKLAARYADIWNTFSWCSTFEERLEEIRQRNELVNEYCREIGRDRQSLRRSYLMFDPEARRRHGLISYYESEGVFRETVLGFVDVGITEFLLYYPFSEEQLPVFEKIAREVIPELKEKYN